MIVVATFRLILLPVFIDSAEGRVRRYRQDEVVGDVIHE
jgi:hypothetical protein